MVFDIEYAILWQLGCPFELREAGNDELAIDEF